MTCARQIFCGVFLFLCGVSPGLAQTLETRDESSSACPATLASVRRECGCEPREEAAFNSLAQTKLGSDNLRSRVTDCFKLAGGLSIDRLRLSGDAELTGCLSKMEEQYPEYRQTLAELVKAAKDVPPRKLDIWLGCYGKALGQGGRSSTKPPKNTRTTGSRPSTDASTTAATQEASRLSTGGATAPATQSDIEQRVEAEGNGSVTTEGMEAVHDGKSGLGTVRQVIKASGKSAIHTGPIKAHVGH